ncbi:ABC transporter substrate-binding protein [Serinibacter arcticus]|uniref:Glycerol-3-phosphate ABC transporter, periplasmic glycerol-3-phosphate-binding protein n=1 Tax=Serinibacter arcticus TaxID=1655435 RepID=A0A4Z1E1B2_9MICO|nr:ABC transporter substrate-binding protein [Serinibacter arcticus]TGO04999.1 Glycerol-3-phosphate ABC transporter, periplasmic glycerol-3-phosphate-binding protein [Serinibacter arcticus]
MSSNARPILTAALAAATVAVLAACGPATGSSGSADSAAEAVDFSGVEPATEITFWSNHPGGSIELEKELIAGFEEETGISVELVTAGANYEEVAQKFQTAQTSGDVGDLVVLSDATWFPAYLNGSILPLDDVLEAADVDTSTYQDTLLGDYLYEDDHYAVPYARSTPLFYYNKDHYAAAGLEDRAPETWEEAKEFSAAIATAVPAATPFGYPAEDQYPAWTMSNLVWGFGGGWSEDWDLATVSDENTVAALEFAQASVDDGWAEVASGDPATAFSSGSVSQVIASTGSLSGILDSATFEVGTGFLPGGPETSDGVVPTGGAGVAVASASEPERQLAAAMFAAYLTNAENTAFFSAGTGYLPVQKDADMSAVYAEAPQFEVAVEQLERTRSQDFARVFLPGGDLEIAKSLQAILTQDADVAGTLETLQASLQTNYDRDLKDDLETE